MARSKSRLLASSVRITSNPKARSVAATSSASFLGLARTRLEFLYWALPMTSATRRSAQAALAESTNTRAPHRAATHDEMGLLIFNSGCSVPPARSLIHSTTEYSSADTHHSSPITDQC